MRDNIMKKSTFTSILAEHARDKHINDAENLEEEMAKLPESFRNLLTELKEEEQAQEVIDESPNVIQVNFGGPRFDIPKTMTGAPSANDIEKWYSKSHLYFNGLSIQLDIDGDDIEVSIEIVEQSDVLPDYDVYLASKMDSDFKFALFDGDVQLVEMTGSVIGHTIVGTGTILQHEKVASGEDSFNLRFE